ncbi:MAG: replication factor C large subunit [Candidatus Thermoplasmatota archaeon]|nr:replication factor C large subunit [Candidatus Thermoplasmatota archaeon]
MQRLIGNGKYVTVPWTEKYRPLNMNDLIMPASDKKQIIDWMKHWIDDRNYRKPLILHGDPGTGKTSSAIAIANTFDLGIVEMNASELRNADNMKRIAKMASLYRDLFSDPEKKGVDRIILIDEADNIFESRRQDTGGDYGGLSELSRIVRESRVPIILTMNDLYSFKRKNAAKEIESNAVVIKMEQYKKRGSIDQKEFIKQALVRINNILKNEGLSIPVPVIEGIIEKDGRDIRAIINDIESLAFLKTVQGKFPETFKRDEHEDIFDVMQKSLWDFNYEDLIASLFSSDVSPDDYLQWMNENIQSSATDPYDLDDAFDILSSADIYRGRIIKKQHFGFIPYVQEIAGGVKTAITRSPRKFIKFRFPLFIVKMSRLRESRYSRISLRQKVSKMSHNSLGHEDDMWFLRELMKNDRKAFESIASRLDITESERAVITGAKRKP